MADHSMQNSENHSDRLNAEYEEVLAMYLPFIEEMQEKYKGTLTEHKWNLRREVLLKQETE